MSEPKRGLRRQRVAPNILVIMIVVIYACHSDVSTHRLDTASPWIVKQHPVNGKAELFLGVTARSTNNFGPIE